MSRRNVRFAQEDAAAPSYEPSGLAQKSHLPQSQCNIAAYVSQSPPRPCDITFTRDDASVAHYALAHQRALSDSESASSCGSNDSASSSPTQQTIHLPQLDECMEGLPSGVARPFDYDVSMDLASSGIPSHMLNRPACEPSVQYMQIDLGVTAVQVYVGNPALGYVAVGDVLKAIFASLRRPLPREISQRDHVEFATARRKRLGKAEPREVLLVDMLGYDHFFHGLQENSQGLWQVIFGPRKV
jgi:hypothetical protein